MHKGMKVTVKATPVGNDVLVSVDANQPFSFSIRVQNTNLNDALESIIKAIFRG